MFQFASLISTLICILAIVVILPRYFVQLIVQLSKSKRSGKLSMDFKLLKVFEFHMEHNPK